MYKSFSRIRPEELVIKIKCEVKNEFSFNLKTVWCFRKHMGLHSRMFSTCSKSDLDVTISMGITSCLQGAPPVAVSRVIESACISTCVCVREKNTNMHKCACISTCLCVYIYQFVHIVNVQFLYKMNNDHLY